MILHGNAPMKGVGQQVSCRQIGTLPRFCPFINWQILYYPYRSSCHLVSRQIFTKVMPDILVERTQAGSTWLDNVAHKESQGHNMAQAVKPRPRTWSEATEACSSFPCPSFRRIFSRLQRACVPPPRNSSCFPLRSATAAKKK